MEVVIGRDPHKASHHAFAVDDGEVEVAQLSVRATRTQTQRLLAWAEPFACRRWAIEGADGLGYLLSQQLVAAGERVVNVPATLAARTRVLGSTKSNKTDPNDARSVALTALRHHDPREVHRVGHSEVLRLLAKRNIDIGNRRTQVVCRMHSLLVELAPGGIAKEINACDVDGLLARLSPANPVEQTRYDLAVELLAEIRTLDEQLKASRKRVRAAVLASGTTVTELFGIGPIIAAMLIGFTGDIHRFSNRDHFAQRIEYIAINTVDFNTVSGGTDGRPPAEVHRCERVIEIGEHRVDHDPDPADRMIGRDQILSTQRRQHRQLPVRGSTHPHPFPSRDRTRTPIRGFSAPC